MLLKTLKKYLSFTKINLKCTVEYRGAIFFWLVGDMLTTLIMINLWLSSDTTTFTGFTRSSLITYYIVSLLLQWLAGWYPFDSLSNQIKNGGIVFTFKSPISAFFSWFFEDVGWHTISTFVALVSSFVIVILYREYINLNFDLYAVLLTLLAIPGAIFVTFTASFCMGTASFWFTEVSSLPTFYWLGRKFLGGQALPVIFLPGLIHSLSNILPFRYMFSFPLEILFKQLSHTELIIGFMMQILWSVLLYILYRWLWEKGRRHYVRTVIKMKRYLRLIAAFFRYCLKRELEFRANVIFWTLMDFVFLGLLLFSIEIIFGQINSIVGWSKEQVLLLVFTASLFEDIQWTIYLQGLGSYSDMVSNGHLDYLLLKPVNTRFLLSIRAFEFDHYLRIFLIGYLLIRQVIIMDINVGLWGWLGYFILFILGHLIVYNFSFLVTTLVFWFIRIFNFGVIYESITEIGHFPADMFKKWSRLTFTYLIPAGFVSYFPVKWLIGGRGVELYLLPIGFSFLSYVFSKFLWNKGLKRYSSASS